MNTSGDALAFTIKASQQMVNFFTADLNGADWLHRPVPKANCAAWIIGHLILTDRRVLGVLGITELPPIPDDFEKRYARNETAAAATEFGDTANLIPLFDQHRTLLAQTVQQLSPADLDKLLDKPSPRFKTVGEMAAFMALHAVMHAGQISTIRRAMGRPPLA